MLASLSARQFRHASRSLSSLQGKRNAIARRGTIWGALAAVSFCSPAWGIEVVAIEEHWELRIGEPDAESSAPQVSMVMSPYNHLDGSYFLFTLNHRNHPEFTAGGMQVQRWIDDDLQESKTGSDVSPLSHPQDVVTWVQRLELIEGNLRFEVDAGNSQSWGTFGEGGNLRITVATDLTQLNSYRPQISLTQSGVTFAGNRVRSLTLKRLRWTDSTGEEYELEAPIDLDTDLDP